MRKAWFMLGVVLTTAGCAEDAAPPRDAGAAMSEAEVVAIGDSAAVALSQALMSRVQAALRDSGAVHAIELCNEVALPLTAAVQDSLPGGLALKRTSNRIRNPANAPDALEEAALAYFHEQLQGGGPLPSHFVQRTDEGWRYYEPVVIADFCTRCHGPAESIEPGVRRVLAERYPQDQATGYAPGDFRGVIRVSIPDAARGSH